MADAVAPFRTTALEAVRLLPRLEALLALGGAACGIAPDAVVWGADGTGTPGRRPIRDRLP